MEDGQRFDPINAFIVGPLPRSGLWVMKVPIGSLVVPFRDYLIGF